MSFLKILYETFHNFVPIDPFLSSLFFALPSYKYYQILDWLVEENSTIL